MGLVSRLCHGIQVLGDYLDTERMGQQSGLCKCDELSLCRRLGNQSCGDCAGNRADDGADAGLDICGCNCGCVGNGRWCAD